eukprot:GFUD01006910.1.p1 GENE.GFUD01006910.1~~GFUD01006910.1.p1  ORF type:complete len:126 (+),score=32.80 GFUD01006910.1:22-399(+)
MDFCACSPAPDPAHPPPSPPADMKTTCGSSSCSAVNPSLPRCGEVGAGGYQNLCPCEESGRKCLCKPSPQRILHSRSMMKCPPFPDPRNLSSWPIIRKITLVTAGAIPVVWLVVYITLRWHYKLV